jgi:F0F1-type ATP synthase membrane subunit b/b'
MLKNREESIAEALDKAEKAREEALVLDKRNKEFLRQEIT